jgi:hypothetical protein
VECPFGIPPRASATNEESSSFLKKRTKKLLSIAACGAMFAAAPITLPTQPGIRLTYLVPAGWHSAHVVQSLQVVSIEYVPPGQSRSQWTDMVTAVWMQRAMYNKLGDVSATLHATLTKRCLAPPALGDPDYIIGAVYDAIIETIRCGRTPDGFAQIAVIKTIKSDGGFYQLQRAWRRPAVADSYALRVPEPEMAVAMKILGTLALEAVKAR